jgi:hypothetical protein
MVLDRLTVPVRSALRSWRVKTGVQRAIAGLPMPIGDRVYHLMQTLKGLAPHPERNLEFIDRLMKLAIEAGYKPNREAQVVELGSGWFPTTPLAMIARGYASRVHTFDLYDHYSPKRIKQAAATLAAQFPECRALGDVASTGELAPHVEYHPRCNILDAKLPSRSIDLAVSEFVLEHVGADDLVDIHRASREWIADDGLWVHWISPGDHRAHSDASLHSVDFLRFSPHEWERLAGNRFAYHNRLRRPQYRELFAAAGWRVVSEDAVVASRALAGLKQLPVHPDFQRFEAADLVAGSLWFVLAKAR